MQWNKYCIDLIEPFPDKLPFPFGISVSDCVYLSHAPSQRVHSYRNANFSLNARKKRFEYRKQRTKNRNKTQCHRGGKEWSNHATAIKFQPFQCIVINVVCINMCFWIINGHFIYAKRWNNRSHQNFHTHIMTVQCVIKLGYWSIKTVDKEFFFHRLLHVQNIFEI